MTNKWTFGCFHYNALLQSLWHCGKTNARWWDPYNYKLCANPFPPVCITCNQQHCSLEGNCSHWQWIPSQRDIVYLAAPSLSGPSVETQHHNRMTSDQGNTIGEARGSSVQLFCARVINILPVSWVQKIDEKRIRGQNELLTIFSGAKHIILQMELGLILKWFRLHLFYSTQI